LGNVGIAPQVVDTLRGFHPEVANRAYGQAKALFQQVQQGNFKLTDIPNYLQDLQNLERLGRNIFTPTTTASRSIEVCDGISPYAIDLLSRAPKYKFLFVVQFILNDPYTDLDVKDLTFAVKTASRPGLKVHMEEVNFYNFRSNSIIRTEFEEMKLSFHDDTGSGKGSVDGAIERGNSAVRFFNAYMRATVPKTNYPDAFNINDLKMSGMAQRDVVKVVPIEGTTTAFQYGATHGTLRKTATGQDVTNMIREIRVYHVYNFGHHVNVYKFFNPRVTAMSMDDLDMSVGNEGGEINMSFNYDTVYIDTGVPMSDIQTSEKIAGIQSGALYPLRYNKASDGRPMSPTNVKPFGEPAVVRDKCTPSINTSNPPPTNST
jgi:hypothetical protein